MMQSAISILSRKVTPFFMAILFLAIQVASTAAIIVISTPKASAVSGCINDTAGANDEPGQKDLTRLCVDESGLPNTMQVIWNWDDLGTTGNNTMDACGLFDDSDADVNADYSICIITGGTPATIQDVVIYSCGNGANDKCTQQRSVIAGPYDTTCTVTQQATDPFPTGASSPTDTVATCTFHLADLNVQNLTDLELTDVCSYPSSVPGSDPSDCVIIVTDPVATVEVVKDIVPNGDSGLFNLTINGPGDYDKTVTNQGDGGTTGQFPIIVANNGNTVTVSETAGTGTNLADYTSAISCVYRGTTTQVAGFTSTSSTSASFTAKDKENILCTITNTKSGSITIVKDAIANSLQDFAFTATGTGVSNFTLDDDTNVVGADSTNSNTRTFNNLAAGTYTFTEAEVSGWYLNNIDCPNITETKDVANRTVSLTIAAGQNVTCTFENRQLGQIKVTKQTDPNGDPTSFAIAASPSGGVVGNASQNIVDDQTVTYVVKHGTYAVNETVPAGWSMTSNTCSSMVIDGNTPKDQQGIPTRTCLINNTKLSTLTIIKDAVPDSAQDFIFSTTGTGLSGFILDDDADAERSNQQEFSGLMPGSYSVTEQTTTGWSLTGLACTGTGADYDTDDNLLSVILSAGQDITCTFTNTQLGSISGIKFNDLNNNGVYDEGEPALSGWNIFIDTDGNGELDPGELNMITDANGAYEFVGLLPSSYNLFEVMQGGWTQTLSPATVELSAGENETDQNFGNFQSGSINGYKFNDVDGNTEWDEEEPPLSGWTINLYNDNEDEDNLLNNLVATDTTDADGYYEFLSVPAGVYQVCEEQQDGWNQTYPTGLACHTITIDQSGETNANTNFGNQGVGTITVKKDVDTDGDGVVNDINSAEWTFDIDGTGDYVTGSTVGVAAGNYEVSEDQKEDYSVVGLECKGEGYDPSETVDISVAPGEDVVCTFTNARDSGTLKVVKDIVPADDSGSFDLLVDGEVKATVDAEDIDKSTGELVVVTGDYVVSETAGDDSTNLDDYIQVISGDCDADGNVSVAKGEDKVCYITNTRKASIVVTKDAIPNDEQDFDFSIESYEPNGVDESQNDILAEVFAQEVVVPTLPEFLKEFSLDDDGDEENELKKTEETTGLTPGWYIIKEDQVDGWDLANIYCDNEELYLNGTSENGMSSGRLVYVGPGDEVSCTFTNVKRSSLTIVKDAGPDSAEEFSFSHNIEGEESEDFMLVDDGVNADLAEKKFVIKPGIRGSYFGISEADKDGWILEDFSCSNDMPEEDYTLAQENGYYEEFDYRIIVRPGEDVTCTFVNKQVVLNLEKSNDQPTPTVVGDVVTYTLVASIPQDAADLKDVAVTDLPPENFVYVPGTYAAVSSTRGDLVAAAVTGNPNYASPGNWELGDVEAGEVITMTYDAQIAQNVSDGEYPDQAFARGYDGSEGEVLSNLTVASTPFVGTEVAVISPAEVTNFTAVPGQLAETGQNMHIAAIIAPILLLGFTALAIRASRPDAKKGGRR